MNTNHLRLCAWAGPVFVILMGIGYLLTYSVSIPPINPAASAEHVAGIYAENINTIRLGLVFLIFGATFFAPFMAAITVMMSRMGNPSPALILVFTMINAGIYIGLFVILVAWGGASYRPSAFPEITRAFHDYTFIFLLWPGTILPMVYIALALAILSDTRTPKVFPRWFAYYSFWSALMALTGCLIVFFKHGPFAINGLFAFWINLGTFFLWYIVVAVLLLKSVGRELKLVGDDDSNRITT